jgi:peptidoglycan hydrolase-like protein with peptidoglycan-binding domain
LGALFGASVLLAQSAEEVSAPAVVEAQTVEPALTPPVRRPRPRNFRASQRQPTRERYRQIQQALIDRGYLEAPADGMWGPKSQAALQDFERDQSLNPDGKIDSLSLIALGLGPARAASLAAVASPSESAPAPAAGAASQP